MSRLTRTVPQMAADALAVLDPSGGWSAKRHGFAEMIAALHNLRSAGADLSHRTTSLDGLLAALANTVASRSDLTARNTGAAELLAIIRNAQTTDPDLSRLSSALAALWDGALGLTGAGGGPSYSAEATALFAAMSVQPDATRKALIDTFIAALKTAGVWSELDLLYGLAAHDSQGSLLNWKAPASFAALGEAHAPTFTTDRGWQGNGTSQYLRTQWTPSVNAVKMTQNNASAWAWSLTDAANNTGDIGDASAQAIRISTRSAAGALTGRINDNTGSTVAVANSIGFFGAQRTSATVKRMFKDGVEVFNNTAAVVGLSATEQWICGANATGFSAKQLALAAWGASLNGLESTFYAAAHAYLQGVGAAA